MSASPTDPGEPRSPVSGPAPVLGRRERKKLQTREALRTSALRLFAEKGFDHTTIEDITHDADLAPRTFFLHFASKDDVLLGDAREDAVLFRDRLAAQPDGLSALEAIRRTVAELTEQSGMSQEEMVLRARLMEEAPSLMAKNLEQYTTFEAMIAHDVARRSGQDAQHDVAPYLLSACAMTALRVAVSVWYRRGGTGDLSACVTETFDLLAAGFDTSRLSGNRPVRRRGLR